MKNADTVTGCWGSSPPRPGSAGGEPMRKDPAGMGTMSRAEMGGGTWAGRAAARALSWAWRE